jgi:MraZ protein
MSLFLATHHHKIDAKGRVSLPASFRSTIATALLETERNTIVVFPSHKGAALEGCSLSLMTEISQRIDKFDLFSDVQDDWAATIFGRAVPLTFDETGRIQLPAHLLAHAGLSTEAAFVGLGNKFQIWAPEALATRQDAALQKLKNGQLTLPKGGA